MFRRLILLVAALMVPVSASAQVSWEPAQLSQPAFNGSVSFSTITFTSEVALSGVTLWVTPELAPYVSTEPTRFETVPAGIPQTVTLVVRIPPATVPRWRDGSIHLQVGAKTIARPMPVRLAIQPPGPELQVVGPEGGIFGFPGGVVLDVPAGALSSATPLTVDALSCADVDGVLAEQVYASHRRRCLGGFSGGPDGLAFARPVKAWLPVLALNPSEFPLLGTVNLSQRTYAPRTTRLRYIAAAGVVAADVSHFSDVVVLGWGEAYKGLSREEGPCRTCDGSLTSGCERFNDDPKGNSCCLVPLGTRLACPRCQADLLSCCKELGVTVISPHLDYMTTDCDIVSTLVTVTFPYCPGAPTQTTPVESLVNCAGDWNYEASVQPPAATLFVCQARELTPMLTATSPDGSKTVGPRPVLAAWDSDDPVKVPVNPQVWTASVQGTAATYSPVNVWAAVNETEPVVKGVSQITVVDPTVTITAADGRSVAPLALGPGEFVTLTADLDLAEYGVALVEWSIADPQVAIIDAATGVIGAGAGGNTTVTAKVTYGIVGTCQNTVYATAPVRISDRVVTLPPFTLTWTKSDTFVVTPFEGDPYTYHCARTRRITGDASMSSVSRDSGFVALYGELSGVDTCDLAGLEYRTWSTPTVETGALGETRPFWDGGTMSFLGTIQSDNLSLSIQLSGGNLFRHQCDALRCWDQTSTVGPATTTIVARW